MIRRLFKRPPDDIARAAAALGPNWGRAGAKGPLRRAWLLPSLLLLTAITLLLVPAVLKAADDAGAAPDGFIVFAAGDRAHRSLMGVDPAGGLPMVLANTPGLMDTQPTVGPDGQLAWIRQNEADWDLVVDGRVLGSGGMHLSPAYMPDGALSVSISGPEETSIFAIYPSGQKKLLVSGGSNGLAVSPTFSPDGQRMAYVSNQSNIAQIYVAELMGGGSRVLTPNQVRSTGPAWSPTGELIVFVAGEKDICLIKPDGQNFEQLTRDQGLNRDPSFSPSGDKIVFSTDRDGYWRLYVMNLDGGGQRPLLPDLTVNQTLPFWSAVAPKKSFSQ